MLRSTLLCACLLHSAEAFLPAAPAAAPRPSAFPRIAARSSRGNSAAFALRSSAEDGAGSVDRRAALQGLALLALGVPTASGAAPPRIQTRNGAGLDVNKQSRFEDVDISSAIDQPMSRRDGEQDEAPVVKKKAPPQNAKNAIFSDDALGYAFAVPPTFQGQSQAVDNGGQIIAFFDAELEPRDVSCRITLVAQPSPVANLEELESALQLSGKKESSQRLVKEKSRDDGEVLLIDQIQDDKTHIITVFALRLKPNGSDVNWLVSLSAQAKGDTWPEYEKRFRAVVKSFKLIYPDPELASPTDFKRPTQVLDEELGTKFQDLDQKEQKSFDFNFGG
ncbi:hypothetical protein T484DRAFT_1954034 [Baffinella frigidus]|nr:hypothetical protein T484DRAFT_1954034 [Cryptophyta sp. CCMP2293]